MEIKEDKRVWISDANPGIQRILEKCINCGQCQETCLNKVGISYDKKLVTEPICLSCGQCILSCPTGALVPRYHYKEVLEYINNPKYSVVVSTAPAVRVAIGDEFGFAPGENLEGKLISALREIGFDYVLDISFGADLTVVEEAGEFLERLSSRKNLPLFTSCCPSWVKYLEIYHHNLLNHLSTTKSPIGMQGAVIKTYFARMKEIDSNKLINIVIAPCTAKKMEIKREDVKGIDYILTTSELAMMIREKGIDFNNLEKSKFNTLLGKGSSCGIMFGNSGGVAESILRTIYYLNNKKDANDDLLRFKKVRGLKNVKEANIMIGRKNIRIAVVYGIKNIELILKKLNSYDLIEFMNCPGGCIGGGGQPLVAINKSEMYQEKRNEGLYLDDNSDSIKFSYQNPDIINLYKYDLEHVLSKKSEILLHTEFKPNKKIFKEQQK